MSKDGRIIRPEDSHSPLDRRCEYEGCGKPIKKRTLQAKCCSDKCARLNYAAKEPRVERSCEWCLKPYLTIRRSKSRYCSQVCSGSSNRGAFNWRQELRVMATPDYSGENAETTDGGKLAWW